MWDFIKSFNCLNVWLVIALIALGFVMYLTIN